MKRLLFVAGLSLLMSGCAVTAQEDYGYRSHGMTVEDQNIESLVQKKLIQADARYRDANISIHSYNGIVLITGQVPSQELRDKVIEITSDTRHARHIHNQLNVSANLRSADKARDTWLTTKARMALHHYKLNNESAPDPSRISLVTENSEMYMMGVVTRQEAELLTDVLKGTAGITRLVKVFDYLD